MVFAAALNFRERPITGDTIRSKEMFSRGSE